MTALRKEELQAQLDSIDARIAKLSLPTVTTQEGERNQADLEILNVIRSQLSGKDESCLRMTLSWQMQRSSEFVYSRL